ncbi:uncharacterized protein BDZ99DRAFT_124451 [Mytilinidion resinicola]|uniref:Uncharacterized protein n=1 Tax=Mytilinidion resinicola TaxID=574789 RepID=A0A6A6Z479_9PEZI|nr:uncharacterized protein BDZ99DRAFT_124451 [Mytilinidion resinicola]KAF2815840.1 hypothetical protein BDZ99DRAFT_124451 [Mytilinidion resinicola]
MTACVSTLSFSHCLCERPRNCSLSQPARLGLVFSSLLERFATVSCIRGAHPAKLRKKKFISGFCGGCFEIVKVVLVCGYGNHGSQFVFCGSGFITSAGQSRVFESYNHLDLRLSIIGTRVWWEWREATREMLCSVIFRVG